MRKLVASVALAASLVVSNIKAADDADAKPNTGALSFSGGVDFVTSYVFRGYEIADSGYIYQPYAQLNVAAYENDSFKVTPYIGLWNSMQENSAPGDSNWWEEDVYGGIDVAVGHFTIGMVYTYYTYPGNAFETVQEIGFKASYDDTKKAEELGLPFPLKPYVAWYIETSDGNGTEDQYAEIGINPTYAFKDSPFTINVPIAIGLSPDGYYLNDSGQNEPFGYVSVGSYLTYALPVPAKFGAWSLYGGATYIYQNADSTRLESGDYEIVGKGGITFSY